MDTKKIDEKKRAEKRAKAKIKWAKKRAALEKAYRQWGGKPVRGRPRVGGPGSKTVLFTIRMPLGLRRQLKPVPADEIRRALDICASRHAQGGIIDTRERLPMKKVDQNGPQGPGQGLEPQEQAPAPAQDAPRGQDGPASGPPAAQAAPGPVKIGWAAGRSMCPDTETLFNE